MPSTTRAVKLMFSIFRHVAVTELLAHRCAASHDSEIPRLIHQTWPNRNSLPEPIQQNIERLQQLNPDWVHKLYFDADIEAFIGGCYGKSMLAAYRSINPEYGAARADLFRYLCVYHFGGIYLDSKSTVVLPLGEVIRPEDRYLIGQWNHSPESPFRGWGMHRPIAHVRGGEYQQWHVTASPGHPFLREVILRVLSNLRNYWPHRRATGQRGVLVLTGPIAYTLAIHPVLDKYPHRMLPAHSDTWLRYSIFEGGDRPHTNLFKKHYTTLNTPIVTPRGLKRLASACLS